MISKDDVFQSSYFFCIVHKLILYLGRPDKAHGPNGKGQIVELDIMEGEAKDIPEVEIGASGKGTGGTVSQQDTKLRTLNSRRRESPSEGLFSINMVHT